MRSVPGKLVGFGRGLGKVRVAVQNGYWNVVDQVEEVDGEEVGHDDAGLERCSRFAIGWHMADNSVIISQA